MGLSVDLSQSSIDFTNPPTKVPIGGVTNEFVCFMHMFEVQFFLSFDKNPKVGFGGAPAEPELWRLGIIQNVLFEKLSFTYDNGKKFEENFTHPIVDSAGGIYTPFYHDPVLTPACKYDPKLSCHTLIREMTPVADIWYSSSGYGELLNPYDASGINANNKPDSLNMIDAPWFRARLRLPSGATITRAERILAFQTWLVAASGGKAKYVLAATEPFSLVFWLTANPQAGALSIDVPPHAFAFYGEAGIARTVRKGGATPTVKIVAGKGGRDPLMTGQMTNDRDEQWMQAKGLKP
jgi:hypothetical protein